MRAAAILAMLGAAAACAQPPEAALPQEGAISGQVWAGTLGDAAITVCFGGEITGDGLYYRNAALAPIRLVEDADEGPGRFTEIAGREDETGAVWTLRPAVDDRREGEWRQGDVTLPIRLSATPVALPDYGGACETAAFLDGLLAGGTITRTPARLGAADYTELAYQGPARAGLDGFTVMSFALNPARAGDAAINRVLAAALPDGTAGHMMGQCVGQSLPGGMSGYREEALVPLVLTGRWLGIRRSGSSYCGGARPDHFTGFAVFDRDSGAEVDPATWFARGELAFHDDAAPAPGQVRRPVAGLSDALSAAVLTRLSPNEADQSECFAAARDSFGWDIGLTLEGPVFVPQLPHVIFACTEEIVLPWAEARPFLSGEGRAVMESFK